MEEPKQSTIRSTTDGGSTGAQNMKSTTTCENTQQTPNVTETKPAHHSKLGRDGKRSIGTPGGVAGTHDYPLEFNSEGSTGRHDCNNIKPNTDYESSQVTKQSETEASPQISNTLDGTSQGGTEGSIPGTHGYQKTRY